MKMEAQTRGDEDGSTDEDGDMRSRYEHRMRTEVWDEDRGTG